MATKKKEDVEQKVPDTAKNGYSTSGLNSRQEVENALAGAQYQPSQKVQEAEDALKQWQANRPADYESRYQHRIDSLLDQLNGRENFQYNYALDPLYQQYAQMYTQNAANASADAAAQAAALTGGYGSSYAISAAQQAYQQQMNGLNATLPTLYQLALDTYNSGGDELVNRIDMLTSQEENAQKLYNNQLSDYYTQLEQKGGDYNTAYAQDYGQYQDYLSQLDSLHGYYSAQEQAAATKKQQTFNNVMSVLGMLGDAVQLYFTGTAGIGSMMGSLLNTGYNIYSGNRAYEADRADSAWSQQMQELQRQDNLTQQQYKNEQAERQYQDSLKQQQFDNNVTSEKLNIAKGEWALKQAKAAQSASKGSSTASSKTTSSAASGSTLSGGDLTVGKSSNMNGTVVPFEAARMRSMGRSDSAIRTELLKNGYTNAQITAILKQMNS
mgnify:FL=1